MKSISFLMAGCMILAAVAGCVDGGNGNDNTSGEFAVLARLAGGEWSNATVIGEITEIITADNRAAPAGRTKTAPSFEFKAEGASDAVWGFGDGETGTGKEASHTYAAPGEYLVIANSSGKSANITVAVNYLATGSDSVTTLPGSAAVVSQEGTSYYTYKIILPAGAKVQIDLDGTGTVDAASDIDMRILDPSGKEIASSTGATTDEQIAIKKTKAAGEYTLLIGQLPGGPDSLYTSVGDVPYTFKVLATYV
ncbi:MAG: PKD domain-containing protein [Candidatus Thermoplasmatota archaeon]|nr:PKD domain-containing protein [Candidatus Thermoplasmatota archaeon]